MLSQQICLQMIDRTFETPKQIQSEVVEKYFKGGMVFILPYTF